ncbi:hypothetical protein BPOR_0086g00170 [Botrytis porri]|uniref:Plastocyanin-like domain-containing protein n=1 Tax=Botrytis porri TaxID=87229 RepID=A0A4Z1KZJ0_9HELO|nr:hypothetical protein BPOR_0086g00170 [Botrytis porri]
MKFSSISTVSSLLAFTTAQLHTETIPVVCSGAPSSTVIQTVTMIEENSGPYYPTITSKYVTTVDGTVTSVNYDGESKSTVWVYPSGTGNEKHYTVATYENDIVIDVNNVDITIIIVDGFFVTHTPTLPIQTTTTPPYSTETSKTYGEIHDVTVGDKGLNNYSPNQINANVGDIIRFRFLARNHIVTQSNFNTPCNFNGGLDTGFNQFNLTNTTDITRDFVVNTNKPIWFHCAQANPKSNCQAGMVLGINPAGKFDAFLEKAKNSGNSIVIPSGIGFIIGVPAPTDTYTTKTGPWITGVSAPSGYSSTISTYTPVYRYPSIKKRSFQA